MDLETIIRRRTPTAGRTTARSAGRGGGGAGRGGGGAGRGGGRSDGSAKGGGKGGSKGPQKPSQDDMSTAAATSSLPQRMAAAAPAPLVSPPPPSGAQNDEAGRATIVIRAFQLALSGAAELGDLISSGHVDASACRLDGMYRGWSLLHAAASKGHDSLVATRLAAGADAAAINSGKTAARLAEAKGHSGIAARLDALGARREHHRRRPTPSRKAPRGDSAERRSAGRCRPSLRSCSLGEADARPTASRAPTSEASLIDEWTSRLASPRHSLAPRRRPLLPPHASRRRRGEQRSPAAEGPWRAAVRDSSARNSSAGSRCRRRYREQQCAAAVPGRCGVALFVRVESSGGGRHAPREVHGRRGRERERCLELSPLEMLRGTEAQRRPRVDFSRALEMRAPATGSPPSPCRLVIECNAAVRRYALVGRADVPRMSRYVFIADRLRGTAGHDDPAAARRAAPRAHRALPPLHGLSSRRCPTP